MQSPPSVCPSVRPFPLQLLNPVTYDLDLLRLDQFWSNQDVLYDYKADLHGTGNRRICIHVMLYYLHKYFSHTEALKTCFHLLDVMRCDVM